MFQTLTLHAFAVHSMIHKIPNDNQMVFLLLTLDCNYHSLLHLLLHLFLLTLHLSYWRFNNLSLSSAFALLLVVAIPETIPLVDKW